MTRRFFRDLGTSTQRNYWRFLARFCNRPINSSISVRDALERSTRSKSDVAVGLAGDVGLAGVNGLMLLLAALLLLLLGTREAGDFNTRTR